MRLQTDRNSNFRIQQRPDRIGTWMWFIFAVAFGLWVLAPLARAQSDLLDAGDRVRITVTSRSPSRVIGTLVAFTPSSVTIATEQETLYIQKASIEQLAVSLGKKRNTIRGALVGGATGGIVLGMTALADSPPDNPCVSIPGFICGRDEVINARAVISKTIMGVVTGAAAGAMIGTFIRTDRWEKCPLQVSLELEPAGGDERPVTGAVSIRWPL